MRLYMRLGENMMRLFVFYGILFSLFGIYLSRYISQYREAYELWVKEIVYRKDTINEKENGSKKPRLFSKIESLARELCQIADAIFLLFTILCLTFLLTASATISYLRSQECGVINHNEQIILILSLIISTIIFLLLPILLRSAHIHILDTSKTSKIDEKVFEVWYKYRCFEHRDKDYSLKLQPRRLYETLARKYDNEENIDLPKPLIEEMERKNFLKKKRLNP